MKYPTVLKVEPLERYRLLIDFDTGEVKIFDVTPYIIGNWYGKLRDLKFFASVHPNGNTVEWADGQDIAPHELYEMSVAWNPDFTKLTPAERARLEEAKNDPETTTHEDINRD